MSGKPQSTINSRLARMTEGERITYIKTAEMQTQSGLQTVHLIPESLIIEWLPKDNPTMATQLMKLGVRVYLHKLAGYQVNSSAITTSHKIPSSYAEALLEAGRLALENEKLIAEAKENKPKIDFANAIAFSDDSIEFHELAKMLGTGRNRLMKRLREIGVLMQNSTIPYQKYVDAGYFEVSQEITKTGKLVPFALVTGKGQIWLHQKLCSNPTNDQGFLILD
jgi:phage antirepressor YoqD-like protein